MANTAEYGFVWLIGNTIVILLVSIFCGIDVLKKKSIIEKYELCKKRLWVLPFMALALLFPYGIGPNNAIIPQFGVNMFTNEAGLTYCMITPINPRNFYYSPIDRYAEHFITHSLDLFLEYSYMNWFILQPVFWGWHIAYAMNTLSLYSFIVLRKERPALVQPDSPLPRFALRSNAESAPSYSAHAHVDVAQK